MLRQDAAGLQLAAICLVIYFLFGCLEIIKAIRLAYFGTLNRNIQKNWKQKSIEKFDI